MSNPETNITDVKGIGPARAKKLKEAGISNPQQLAAMSAQELAETAGISATRAQKLITNAKTLVGETSQQTNSDSVSKQQAFESAKKAMDDLVAKARDHFKEAPQEHVFVLADGQTLSNLLELAVALDDIHQDVFESHVNDEKHDFASWVEHVLKEKVLANELREARKHPREHSFVIYRHISKRAW